MRLLLVLLLVLSFPSRAALPDAPPPLRVLFVGNSLIYTNDLPALLRALAAAQPEPVSIETRSFVAPGGTLAERRRDGHVERALRAGHWDAVVLQERGGQLACLLEPDARAARECRDSVQAHQHFRTLARTAGARTLLLATWAPDDTRQQRLDQATAQLAAQLSAEVVPAGAVLQDYARDAGRATVFPDGMHPGVAASLVMAARLFESLTGHAPQAGDMHVDFALLPPNAALRADLPLERQPHSTDQPLLLKASAIAPLLDAARHCRGVFQRKCS